MFAFSQLLSGFFIAALVLSFCFVLGYAFARVVSMIHKKGTGMGWPLYWYGYIGLVLSISMYAVFRTGGLTILLPVPILLYVVVRQLMHTSPSAMSPMKPGNDFKIAIVAFLGQFFFFAQSFWSFDARKVKYLSGDFNIYHRMANRLNVSGIEAYNFNIFRSSLTVPSPYHFGDIWGYAIANRFFSANPSISFIVSFTTLSVIFTMGILALVQRIFRNQLATCNKSICYLVVFAGLFAGINQLFPSLLRAYAEPYTLSVFNWGKVLLLSTSIIGVFWAFSVRSLMLGAVSIAIAGLLYINAIPALFGSAFLLLTLLALRGDISKMQWIKYHLVYIGVTFTIVIFLYKIYPSVFHKNPVSLSPQAESVAFLHGMSVANYLRTVVNIFIGGWFQLFTILPYLFLLVLALWRKPSGSYRVRGLLKSSDWSVLFLAFLFISGLGAWALLFPVSVDSVQFFHNILAPVYAVGITLGLFLLLLQSSSKILRATYVLICVWGVWSSCRSVFYATEFERHDWERMSTFFKKESGSHAPQIVNLKSMGELSYWSAKKTDQYIPLGILCYQWPDYHNVCLNTPYIAVSNGVYAFEEKKDIESASFSIFRSRQMQAGITNEELILKHFFEEFQPRYLFVSKDTSLPSSFTSMVLDSLDIRTSDFMLYKLR